MVDPWAVLRRLRTYLRPGGLVMASSPNVSHYSVIGMLLKGDWTLADSGRMDRTHLRWFTPRSYADMFKTCGFEVLSTEPLRAPGQAAKLIARLSGGRLEHLFVGQIVVVGKKTGGLDFRLTDAWVSLRASGSCERCAAGERPTGPAALRTASNAAASRRVVLFTGRQTRGCRGFSSVPRTGLGESGKN